MQSAVHTSNQTIAECKFCAIQRLIPVLFERHRNAIGRPGKPFRQCCLECERWLKMGSRSEGENHPNAWALPAAFSSENPLFVPAEDTEFADELADYRAPSNSFRCQACNSIQTGYPEQCSHCGAPYEWS